MVRAVFEGVAYNSRWLLKYVEQFTKRRMEAINILGGGAKSEIWCQIHADVLDRRIRQVKDPILANVRGAALLASAALGYIRYDEIASRVPIARVLSPIPIIAGSMMSFSGVRRNLSKQPEDLRA